MIQLDHETLTNALLKASSISDAASSRLPSSYVNLKTETPGCLTLKTSDFRLSYQTSIPVQKSEEPAFWCCVPAKPFAKAMKALNPKPVRLQIENSQLLVFTGRRKRPHFKLQTFPVEVFPKVLDQPEPQGDEVVRLEKQVLAELIELTSPFTSGAQKPPLLNLQLTTDGQQVEMVGSNQHVLAHVQRTSRNLNPKVSLLVPNYACKKLREMAQESSLTLYQDEAQICARGKQEALSWSQWSSDPYPQWRRVLKVQPDLWVQVNVAELRHALKLVGIFGLNPSPIVEIALKDGKLRLRADSPTAGEFDGLVPTSSPTTHSDPLPKKVQIGYLTSVLRRIQTLDVMIGWVEPQRGMTPLVLKNTTDLPDSFTIAPLI